MRTRVKLLALVMIICLASAAAASLITAVLLTRGIFGYRVMLRGPDSEIPAETTSPASSQPAPTSEPTLFPTPEPTAMPTTESETEPAADPANETDPVQEEPFWQSPEWLSDMYERVAPSVAGIRVEVDETSYSVRRTNEGSGIIMNEDGIIVTSTEILAIALDKSGKLLSNARIEILLHNVARPLTAELVGRDPMTGISVLKVNSGYIDLEPAVIASSPEMKVGQIVFAIGYPDILNESGTLTTGIISGLHHPVSLEDGTTLQMIQTDVRLSQSCTGGPLVNLDGEIIAVTACDPARSASDSQNQAIPALAAQLIVDDLTSQGYVGGRAWLGVTVLVEETFIELQNLYKFPDGLYISSVIEGSPAYLADLRRGDIITSINGDQIDTSMEISDFLQSQPVGTMVEIMVYRREEEQYHECNVYLQEYRH